MIFGNYEYKRLELTDIVVLPQVRKTKNSKIEEMADSIEDKGLINPLDVARLTELQLLTHVRFLTQLWKKEINIESFQMIDGFYYVLIAGHTRLEALKKNAKKKKRKDQVTVKIHNVKTSEEILAIQLDENIHSEPKIEERAIAIIETYHIGILGQKWKNKEDFIKKNSHKFSRRVLNEALVFSNLSPEVQEYVFSHNVPFAIGVELGRIYPLVEAYEKDQDVLSYKENVELHYAILLGKLQHSKSVKKGLSLISGYTKTLNDHFRKESDVQQEMIDWFLNGVDRQYDLRKKELLNEHSNLLREIKNRPFEYYMNLLVLDRNLTGVNHEDDLQKIKKLYNDTYKINNL